MAASSAPCGLTSRVLLDPNATTTTTTRGKFGPRSVRLPMLPIVSWKNDSCCSRTASGSVVAKATGETPAQVSSELPEIVTTVKEAWKKLDDKYAVASLAFIGIIALWSSTGIISAIDKLPIIPGVLELIGIGYTGWFVYNNLLYKPDREALIEKVKSTYSDIIGNSS
ncbi:protein CURVATURE THYLAKOID 1B, chloroplastic-like [Zingiber officinale]|uniref:protein CURVATURE THYLAKOID 1B, chloroplastic-like n=1 Tax=Zingiber officinale TaxID=94328 RepID=UPI001C4BCD26|nr:protein CURVATURE THYLAKOID 1B, chloroplastic-like [Zingiber officinale]